MQSIVTIASLCRYRRLSFLDIMEENKPVFSIITVCYCARDIIAKTAHSVLSQTYPNIEYIVVDGASPDNTAEVVRSLSSDIRLISEPDKGLYDAMNKGLRMALGDYVWFLNAGDLLPSGDLVEAIANGIKSSPMGLPDVLYGDTMLIDATGKEKGLRRLRPPFELQWRSFADGMLVCHQAFIAKRLIAPPYNMKYRFSADFDWCIRILQAARNIVNTEMILVHSLDDRGGITYKNHKASLKERFLIMKHYYGSRKSIMKHLSFFFRRKR